MESSSHRSDTPMPASSANRHELHASFDQFAEGVISRAISELQVRVVTQPQENPEQEHKAENILTPINTNLTESTTEINLSPLMPSTIINPRDEDNQYTRAIDRTFEQMKDENDAEEDPASGAVLIYPKKIDDLRRFRMLYVGLLLFILSSMQGVHALFGVLLMEQQYMYTAEQMVNIYIAGAAFGMFVFPFGVIYDWFGPRFVIFFSTVCIAISTALFSRMFAGHIKHTPTNAALLYALMSWGCYAMDVAVLPCCLTHMPRDRGQPTGLLKTFSGLGASFLSCMYRGFFINRFDNLMWLMFALNVVIGLVSTVYMEDAPYIVNRWRQRTLTPREQLRCYLIRNRYMAQLMPRERFLYSTIILVVLNVYLTVQAVCAAYFQDSMTTAKYRGIAIGAIIITVSTCILAVPAHALDGLSPQDKQVIEAAKQKEEELHQIKLQRHIDQTNAVNAINQDINNSTTGNNESKPTAPYGNKQSEETTNNGVSPVNEAEHNDQNEVDDDDEEKEQHIEMEEREMPDREIIEVHVSDLEDSDDDDQINVRQSISHTNFERSHSRLVLATKDNEVQSGNILVSRPVEREEQNNDEGENEGEGNVTIKNPNEPFLKVAIRKPSTYKNPIVETMTFCGEVFVLPLYQTSFLESLTYIDIWLMFFTTMFMWGVGLTLTANWNIEIMMLARYIKTDYKLYILFASMAGVMTAAGRVVLGLYEIYLPIFAKMLNITIPLTIGYPIASVGMLISMILWIALPGGKVLVLVYIAAPLFYGFSTSITVYVLGTIFDRDIGMHYGFCFLGAAIGMVFCFRLAFFETYRDAGLQLTPIGLRCVGQRKCMNKAVGVYIVFIACSIVTSFLVHYRYDKLVRGKLKRRRVIVPVIKRVIKGSIRHHDEKSNSHLNDPSNAIENLRKKAQR